MSVLGKSAKLGLGVTPNYIAGIRSITFTQGVVKMVESDLMEEDVPTQYAGSRAAATIKVTVEKLKSDTNGQVALATAFAAKTSLQFTLATEGTTAGSEKLTGTCFVEDPGEEVYEKNTLVVKNITLKVSGAYTTGVFP